MAEDGAKHWLKYGLFGCLGCFGLVVVLIGLAVGTAWLRVRSEKVEDRVLSHPAPAKPVEPASETAAAFVATTTTLVPSKKLGTVVLDLHDAEFHIEPGAAGDPIRVEARYDRNSFRLEESSDESADGTWTYGVTFRRSAASSWWFDLIQRAFSANDPEVRIFLPRGTPIALQGRLERGGLEVELGGLHLTSALLNVSMGGLELNVSEPLAAPMDRFEVKTEMGGAELRSIGNASPRILQVEYRMGGLECDLNGAWSTDAEITLRGGMGGAEVRLPKDVRIEGVPGRQFEGPQTGETNAPTLRFKSTSELGDVEFVQ